jgi:deoxyribodipyrimidine photolyase
MHLLVAIHYINTLRIANNPLLLSQNQAATHLLPVLVYKQIKQSARARQWRTESIRSYRKSLVEMGSELVIVKEENVSQTLKQIVSCNPMFSPCEVNLNVNS